MNNYFFRDKMNLNKYFVALLGVLLGFILLGSTVCAQDSRLYITVPAKAGSAKSGGAIGPLQNGQVYCSYEEGSRPKLYLENAQAMCTWEVRTTSGSVNKVSEYGQYNDTIVIEINTNGNQLSTVTISVTEGSSYTKDLAIYIPRRARKAGDIIVSDLILDTTYCANLEYNVRVAEDPDFTTTTDNYGDNGTYPEAQLRYRWTLRDNNGVAASQLLDKPAGMYTWKYTVPENATAWVVQPKTCENVNTVTDPTRRAVINVIPKNLTNAELSVKALRFTEEGVGEKTPDGKSIPDWDTSGKPEYRNACVWYSSKYNSARSGNIRTDKENLGYGETGNGYVYLQAEPYRPNDLSFRHYEYEWIFNEDELVLDTLRMQESYMRDRGFGLNKGRVCFRIKARGADQPSLENIEVRYKMHCSECNRRAANQDKSIIYESKESLPIVLPRIDTILDAKVSYTPRIEDEDGIPVQVVDELPRLCGLTEYHFCSTTQGDSGRQTEYLWYLGAGWTEPQAPPSGAGDCLVRISPAIEQTDTKIGDTIYLHVNAANYCFQNGNDTSRNAQIVTAFLRSVPKAPIVIDTISGIRYSGYSREQLEYLSGMSSGGGGGTTEVPWPIDGVKNPLLLCNYTFLGLNVGKPLGEEQAFLLYTKDNQLKPIKYIDGSKDGGFQFSFPKAMGNLKDVLEKSWSVQPYKGKESSDTNVLRFNFSAADREALDKQKQIVFCMQAANECGLGNPSYLAINVIDTIHVLGHVQNGSDDRVYDTLSLCEGTELNMRNFSATELADEYSGKLYYIQDPADPDRNTDVVHYRWRIPSTWRFENPATDPTSTGTVKVWIGQEKGAVRLALRNRCGMGRWHSGDSINVNPYTRLAVKVATGLTIPDKAYSPDDASQEAQQAFENNQFLLRPCQGSEIIYAGDTTERTDGYRWEFPPDWQVVMDGADGSRYVGTTDSVDKDHINWAYTSNQHLNSSNGDMRVRVRVGADTGNIYVVGRKAACGFEYDNYAPNLSSEPPHYGHRRDSMRVIVRPFTGKPMQDGAWPDSICVRKVVSLSVQADINQDSLTRAQTHFTWKFPSDYADFVYGSDNAEFPDRNTTLTFTVPERTGEYDTIRVYSHRYDCEAYNQGDSMVVILKLTDTIPFVANAYVNDARRPGNRLNLTPCEGDTVVYRVLPDPKRYLDGVWFTWNGGNAFKDTASGLIDSTGWRVLNPLGHYADTLKMIVGRSYLQLGAQAVSPCGMSSVKQTELNPIGLVRDTIHVVKGRDLLCINEKVVFEWDSVKYATQYDWFYPWGKKHDTLGIDRKMFYREFSRRTAFDTGYIYVRPSNVCGLGPYSDSIKVTSVIRHLSAPTVKGINPSLDLTIVRDTAYDTLCLRTSRFYEAQYSDADYVDNTGWRYRWFGLTINAQDTLAVDAASATDSSVYRFRNQAGFETKYIGVSVHHKDCALGGDTLTLRIVPADTVAMDDAGLADRLSDLHREDHSVMTKPCGTDTAEWHFNGDFGKEEVSYRFVWWKEPSDGRTRTWNVTDSTMGGGLFKWLNPKTESNLENAWYKKDEDVLRMRVANNQTLFVSVDLKNRCGISHLPALDIRTVTSIADSLYQLSMVSDLVCDGDSLLFKVDSSANIGGFVWHYPWGAKIDSVKVGTQVRRSFNVPLFDTGYVYVVPYNGCGNAKTSNRIHISEVLRVPERAVPSNFDPAYDYDVNHVAIDTLCMRTRQVLRVRSDSWEEGKFETQWRLVQGNATGFERGLDSCVLRQEDVNAQPFLLEFASRAKGCKRYSDTLFIRIVSMDTLTFTMVEDEDEGLGRLEVLLPAIIQNYADGTPVDRKPCGGSLQKYTIAEGFHWSLVNNPAPYFSWQGNGQPEEVDPAADKTLGGTDWTFEGEPAEVPGRYHDLPVRVGAKDMLLLHVNLQNICGSSHSPALILQPKPAVTQKPVITPEPICIGNKLAFDCAEVDNTENYYWEFPWNPYRDTTGVPHVEIPEVTDMDGNVVVYGANDCGKGPADTLKAMVIHTPKAPLPDWRNGTHYWQNDTVYDTICLYSSAILKVRQDEEDAPGVKFKWECMDGCEDMALIPADTLCTITPAASATDKKSVLLGVYGYYADCSGGEGEKRFIRIYFEDTLASALVGNVLVDPADLMTDPTLCPEEEIVLRVENDIAPAYKWSLPATWNFKELSDSTTASITVVAGTARGRIGVKPLRTSAPMGCGSLDTKPFYSVEFIPRGVPVTPAFTSAFETYPCVGSVVTYRLANVQAENIKAYRWEFPADWRVPGTDAAVVGSVGDTNVVPVTQDAFCAVIVGKDSGDVRVYAMDSCGERLVRGNANTKAVYPIDTARLQVLGDRNVCLDSTVYLTVEFLNTYTKNTGYDLRLEYVDADDEPLVVEVEDEDSTHLKIKCTNRDTVRMIFTPYNLFACPDNVKPFVHYIITDTMPEIPGVIEGPSVVCVDNPYTYVFHVDAEKKAIFEEIEYSWVVPQGWHIENIENDTVLHVYFDSVSADMPEYDTIFCYPSAGCGTAFPTILVLTLQEPDKFNDSIEVDYLQPCIGTELQVWLRDADTYNTDTIRFIWNTPTGRDADWERLDSDSLPRTSYRVQYDTASYISVRYRRDHGCGMSMPLTARVVVRDSAAKARFDGFRYPCYTREFYELAVFPDPDHIDSVSWMVIGSLTATEHTRVGSSIKNDSLAVANPDHVATDFSVGVRTFNECGSRDTVFRIIPVTTISNFTSSLRAPRLCVSDTGYAYIDLTPEQQNQGLFFEWRFVPDTAALSLNEFVAGDTTAVLQFLSGAGNDSLQVVLLAGNDCSMLADSMLRPQVVNIVPFTYRVASTYDAALPVVYGFDSLRLEVDSVSVGRIDEYDYTWHPENRLYEPEEAYVGEAWTYTKVLVQDPETFSVTSRQRRMVQQEGLPFYRRDGLCYSYDTLLVRVDSLLSVFAEEELFSCVNTEYLLQIDLLGGNYDRMRVDTSGGCNSYSHSISWWRLQDDTLWQEIPEGRNQTSVVIAHNEAGDYLYRVIVSDSTVLRDSAAAEPVLATAHADTADMWVIIYAAPQIHFTNVSSSPVEVAVGSRIEIDSRVEEGTGYYVYRWSSEPDTSLILPGYEDREDTRTHSIYQRARIILTVSDTLSGCLSSDTVAIHIGKGVSDIANAFTPNDDGKNDVFLKGVSELSIFTRWGEQIFHTTGGEGWDGTHKGKKVRPGDYLYVAVVYNNGEKLVFKGVVTVLKVD